MQRKDDEGLSSVDGAPDCVACTLRNTVKYRRTTRARCLPGTRLHHTVVPDFGGRPGWVEITLPAPARPRIHSAESDPRRLSRGLSLA